MHLTERETGVFEGVGVTGGGGVAHVGEFAFVALGTHVEEFGGHGGVEDEVAVEESGNRMVSVSLEFVWGRSET